MALQSDYDYSQDELDTYSRQHDPNQDDYWWSRGYDERPDDWEDLTDED